MQILKRFIRDRSGNFGIMAAVAIVPILGCAGLAIDFSRAIEVKASLQSSADVAVLGAISEKSAAVAQAVAMSGDGTVTLGERDAKALFAAQRRYSSGDADVALDSVAVTVVKTGKNIKANMTYAATVPTSFLRILGRPSISVAGKATATYQSASFIDIYMLLDNTPSMGVAATLEGVDALIEATRNVADSGSRNCAFACHIVSDSGVVKNDSNYFVARANNIPIRIDVVAQAVAALTTEADQTQTLPNQYRMAAYTFGETARDAQLYKVNSLTSNLDQVNDSTSKIKLMSIPYNGYKNDQLTSFDDALTLMDKEISTPGDGSSSATPEKILFFVSDGVGDSYKPTKCTKKTTGDRCQEPIDYSFCKPVKDRGVKIAVLYTTYLPLPNNSWYNSWIKPFQSEIGTKMEACASPGLYFEVSPTDGIEEAMKTLFHKVVQSPRLTN